MSKFGGVTYLEMKTIFWMKRSKLSIVHIFSLDGIHIVSPDCSWIMSLTFSWSSSGVSPCITAVKYSPNSCSSFNARSYSFRAWNRIVFWILCLVSASLIWKFLQMVEAFHLHRGLITTKLKLHSWRARRGENWGWDKTWNNIPNILTCSSVIRLFISSSDSIDFGFRKTAGKHEHY